MKISIFGILSNIQILVFTALRGTSVGTDSFGNKYYRGKPRGKTTRERRWVIYAQDPEASRVPPEWHGWLHHQTDRVPSNKSSDGKTWIKPHRPNATGTDAAYNPPSLKGKPRDSATADYVAWHPPHENKG